jgi:hypothetical protein
MAFLRYGAALAGLCATAAWLPAQRLKPESLQEFSCYVQSAEARMAARPTFLAIDADSRRVRELAHGGIRTVPGNGANPHKIQGAMLYDWIGTVFIPGVPVQRLVRMLQDYDHRSEYFPDVVASASLQCRTGAGRFGFTMRIKEPVVADSENDVVWERLDDRRWRCRSVSGDVREIGKQHGYLYRLNSYWRLADNGQGVFVEGETITLSGEFGSLMRTLGSLAGVNPEKSLKRTLTSMRESVTSRHDFAPPPDGLPACAEPARPAGCPASSRR